MRRDLAIPFVIHEGKGYTYASSAALQDTPPADAANWIQDFRKSQSGKNALEDLESLKSINRGHFNRFRELVLLECYWSHLYKATGDHIWKVISAEWRRQNEADAELAELVGLASEKIESLYHANPWHVSEFVKPAYEKVLGPLPKEEHTERLIDLLDAVRTELGTDPGHTASVYRHWIACFAYDRPVADRNRPKEEAHTGLEFSLALRFKRFTAAKHRDPLEVFDSKWLRGGKPHYKLVARFCNATLGRRFYRNPDTPTIDDQQIEQRLTKLRRDYPDLRYVGWPVRI